MTNTKLFLLIGTSLSLTPNLIFAQCVATQDCETLGYTETSCNGGKGVKCPFGNKWACLPTKETICKEEGFTLTCKGTGEIGSGDSCSNLYKKCSCTSGYEWNNGSCQKINLCANKSNGAYSEVYCCNRTVVGVKASGMNFYVAVKDLGNMIWTNANSQCSSYIFCGNLKGILPTKDQLVTLHNNRATINNLLSTNIGTIMTEDYCWSSTIANNGNHYTVRQVDGFVSSYYADNYHRYACPILTSW